MDERTPELEAWVTRARGGDREALEAVVVAVQDDVHHLATRFLWHPEDAHDATQEILLRVITRLASFRGESAFRTWVYRVATNALIRMKKGRAEEIAMSFEEFADDLTRGLSDAPLVTHPTAEEALLLEEVKIGCTTAMLLCLDRAHRIAYVLGEILELDHRTAAAALEISPANYRKRLSRARAKITDLMRSRCGLFDTANPCRCRRRVDAAISQGRVDPEHLLFASSRESARAFPEVLEEIRRLDDLERAAALYRSHPEQAPSTELIGWLREVTSGASDHGGSWAAPD